MSKVLKVTKPDKTTHAVPLENKPFYLKRNKLAKADDQWKLETISEEEAKKLSFIDADYVTGVEAIQKNEQLKSQLSAKDQEIEDLRKQLADAQSGSKYSAAQAIALIEVAKTAEEVDEVAKGDDRVTVKDAAKNKKKELKSAQA